MKAYSRVFMGEFLGTFILVLFGCGTVAVSILFEAYQGIAQIAIMWGVGVGLAIYATRHLSCAHLNPAVTISMAVNKRMSWRIVPFYVMAQVMGAFLAAIVLYGLFASSIATYESINGIIRGTPESITVAKMFGEYYQLPGSVIPISMPLAMVAEGFGTFLLMLMILSLTDGCNLGKPDDNLAPVLIGLSVSSIICLLAPLTQAGLNPARDFGPRMVALLFGWGSAALPDKNGGFFFVYILAPIIGASIAGGFFSKVIQPLMGQSVNTSCCKNIHDSGSSTNHTSKTKANACCHIRPYSLEESGDIEREELQLKPRIILVGGFLGAGKTTVLCKMAEIFAKENIRVGLITNDQASELVDTAFLSKSGGVISEVSGSCFCCNYNGFADAVSQMLIGNQVDVIIAEPVGSCTDLSATIIQPLKHKWKNQLEVAPLTVLVDPVRLMAIIDGETSGLHKSAAYIVRKQLEEADVIVINKIDLLSTAELNLIKERTIKEWPQAKVYAISGQTGENMNSFLDYVLTSTMSGTHLAHIDYDVYAEGEAVLGWLNATILLESKNTNWNLFGERILTSLGRRFSHKGAEVGHVKLMIQDNNSFVVANLTGTNRKVIMRGQVNRGNSVIMTLNARVEMSPLELETIVVEELKNICGNNIHYNIQVLKCLQPGRPKPTYRYNTVIKR